MNEWDLIWRIGLAFVLSASIGLDREMRQKSAGLRPTRWSGSARRSSCQLAKYGFFDILKPGEVVLDPSRVAAQIVSGIGFIGAGLIFVRRDSVRGLTTAAGAWMTAAIGAAAGASLPVLAIATTLAYFVVVYVPAPLARLLPASPYAPSAVRVVYEDGRGILRRVLETCTSRDFKVADVSVERGDDPGEHVAVSLEVHGRGSVATLAVDLGEINGVHAVAAGDVNEIFDA